MASLADTKEYKGNCHCGLFKFTISVPELRSVRVCDCSYCYRVSSIQSMDRRRFTEWFMFAESNTLGLSSGWFEDPKWRERAVHLSIRQERFATFSKSTFSIGLPKWHANTISSSVLNVATQSSPSIYLRIRRVSTYVLLYPLCSASFYADEL